MNSFFESARILLDLINGKKQQALQRGEYYNVFDVLNLSTDEVRLHSAFIADLLNPKGKHGLGAKPLKSFTKILGQDFEDEALRSSEVYREFVIGTKSQDQTSGGTIDILLNIGGYQIIIENKIYAADQPRQLLRYHNFAKSKPHSLVYMTLDGDAPSDNSSGGLVGGKDYICKSYRNDITRWIEQCLGMAIARPLIRETLQQYLKTIRILTDTDMEENDKSALYEIMDRYTDVTLAIMRSEWGYRQHLVYSHIIKPLQGWCKQKQYICHIGPEFENQGSGVWFGISQEGWKKLIVVKFNQSDYRRSVYGIGERDMDKHDDILMQEEIPVERYADWSVDIAKDIISGKVLDYVCGKFEEIMAGIISNPKKILNLLIPVCPS